MGFYSAEFIADHLKPKPRTITETLLYMIFNFDNYTEPDPENMKEAIDFYKRRVLTAKYFDNWMRNHLCAVRELRLEREHIAGAVGYQTRSIVFRHFRRWRMAASSAV